MASTVIVDGRPYLRRNPLGVVGLTLITFGIYGLYWWWKINSSGPRPVLPVIEPTGRSCRT